MNPNCAPAQGENAAPAFEAGLHAEGVTFGAEDATLLRRIDEEGSLNAASQQLGRSYSRTHERIEALEAAFGNLIEPERGGSTGGGSELTDRAHELLSRFDRLQTEFSGITAVEETVYEGYVVGRDGEIAIVWTPAGKLRALAPPGAWRVQVTIRADTVTLQAPTEAPPAEKTSARNQFAGTVQTIDEQESVAGVELDIGATRPLRALVTATSAANLGLEPGSEVVASFKTTATRATPKR